MKPQLSAPECARQPLKRGCGAGKSLKPVKILKQTVFQRSPSKGEGDSVGCFGL